MTKSRTSVYIETNSIASSTVAKTDAQTNSKTSSLFHDIAPYFSCSFHHEMYKITKPIYTTPHKILRYIQIANRKAQVLYITWISKHNSAKKNQIHKGVEQIRHKHHHPCKSPYCAFFARYETILLESSSLLACCWLALSFHIIHGENPLQSREGVVEAFDAVNIELYPTGPSQSALKFLLTACPCKDWWDESDRHDL